MHVLAGPWRFDPIVVAGALASVTAYAWGVRRLRLLQRRPWPQARSVAFGAGLAAILLAVLSPLDSAADERFVWHMTQHLALTVIAAPLLVLGAPLLLALAALPTAVARRLVACLTGPVGIVAGAPLTAWLAYTVTLWASHLTGVYQLALENGRVHAVEHAVYLATAIAFWYPVIGAGPAPWSSGPLAYPLRLLYLVFATLAQAFLGFVLYTSRRVLYAHYVNAGLADQRAAGELMWIGSSLTGFVAFMLVAAAWARSEERRDAREARRSV